MLDHQGQISIPTVAAREPVFISTVVSYSLAYDATDVMDNDDLNSDQHSADKLGQKTISISYSLDKMMVHYP